MGVEEAKHRVDYVKYRSCSELAVWTTVWIFGILFRRPHRLAVRTLGSHPSNPGSIPGEVTIV